jgi:hypothetical protein
MRFCDNSHYFEAIRPFLAHFAASPRYECHIVVRHIGPGCRDNPEYAGFQHLFTDEWDLDGYDLVITPTFLRADERTDRTRAVQVFHGMSDKPFTYERDFSDYALCLCSGRKQIDRLHEYPYNRDIRFEVIGYPKFDHPPTLPPLFESGRRTVIYAPTWRKGDISSLDLFLDNASVVDHIVEDYNLVIKPHPNTFSRDRQFYDQGIVDRLEALTERGALLVKSGNVMPFFAQADLNVGDISASCYEWLYFDRPIVFLNPQPGVLRPSSDFRAATYLWQCGEVCENVEDLKSVIDRSLADDRCHADRERLLHHAIHEPRARGATARGVACIEQLIWS